MNTLLLSTIIFFTATTQQFFPTTIQDTQYPAEILRVKDGDTVSILVRTWPGVFIKTSLRLAGVNTPEKRGRISDCERAAGHKATEFTKAWLKNKPVVMVSEVRKGKYAGRMLGLISHEGKYLHVALIVTGHGRVYNGGKRQPWCGKKGGN